jgi:DNA polymerase III subunit epsilon
MLADAPSVHGSSAQFLADEPLFAAVADECLAFVGNGTVVTRNAGFDIAFLNAELQRVAKPPIAPARVVEGSVFGEQRQKLLSAADRKQHATASQKLWN